MDARHRVLVFSQLVDVLELAGKLLEELGETYQYLDGSSTAKQRAARWTRFSPARATRSSSASKQAGLA